MNPAAFHHHHSSNPQSHVELEKRTPASHSYLEPGSEGILFAIICLLCSAAIYGAVLLIRFLA